LGCEPGLFVRHARTQALGDFGQTEIEHLHLPPRGDHQVGALDVAVDDAAPVRLLQRLGNLDADVDRFAEGELPAFELLRERFALDVLHDDEGMALVLADVVNGSNLGRVQRGGGPGFSE